MYFYRIVSIVMIWLESNFYAVFFRDMVNLLLFNFRCLNFAINEANITVDSLDIESDNTEFM